MEAEFFHGAGADEQAFERTDALIRESLQNSLDARIGEGKVRVSFRLTRGSEALQGPARARYLDGLVEHLDSLKNEHVNSSSTPPLDYLVIEDFGTRGLEGNVELTEDPVSTASHEDFYWFWRNVGRSGKGGTDRGRWGLGKTVFQASSRINTVFGLTVRASDRKALLMGQAVAKKHVCANASYMPEGFYCDPEGDRMGPQMPFVEPAVLEAFRRDFQLVRRDEPGLSLVVAFPFATLAVRALMRSAVAHFFLPIMSGALEVTFAGPELPETTLSRESIRKVAAGLDWQDGKSSGIHRPPFDLAQWAIERQSQGMPALLDNHGEKAPSWSEAMFPPGLLESYRASFRGGERLAMRVPLVLIRKGGSRQPTYFDVFVEPDAELVHGEDCYVRGGMTISGMALMKRHRGWRGLLIVEDSSLSSLLGDTEGPAHLEWRERPGDGRADKTWDKWSRRVTFVKRALSELIAILNPPPAKVMEDLLADVFGLEDPVSMGRNKARRKSPGPGQPPRPPVPPEQPQSRYRVEDRRGGFSIVAVGADLDGLLGLRVRVAYDVVEGNPLRQWSPFDFRMDPKAGDVEVVCQLADVVICAGNLLEVQVRPGFRIDVTGFNPVNDLYVKVDPLMEVASDSGEYDGEEAMP